MKRGAPVLFLLCLIFFLPLMSCRGGHVQKPGAGKIRVIASLFPLYDFAREISGERADVIMMLPPGVEPHSFEPKPGDILDLQTADIFIYMGRAMEPWAEGLLKGVRNEKLLVVDASKGILQDMHAPGDTDPHLWLDFAYARKMVDSILDALLIKDGRNRDFYVENARLYGEKLDELDRRYKAVLGHCKSHVFIHGGHSAFNYLARRYGLTYFSAYKGFSPDTEPTPRDLAELTKTLRDQGLHYVFYEELISPRVSETISRETGASLLKLDGAHNITREEKERGITFLTIMNENLRNLAIGLECG
jgi:zinc transport system substrate-binding protein